MEGGVRTTAHTCILNVKFGQHFFINTRDNSRSDSLQRLQLNFSENHPTFLAIASMIFINSILNTTDILHNILCY